MLLAIDIGNTNIGFGLFSATKPATRLSGFANLYGKRGGFANNYGGKGKNLIKRFDIPTKDYTLKKIKKNFCKFNINDTIICSVVPGSTKILKNDLSRWLAKAPHIIGKDIEVPIKNLYRIPRQVGFDRLVNAYAGVQLYGSPLIIVDFGTAITFDVISKRKEYLGGMILPGLKISLDALFKRTALLPEVKLSRPQEFIGRDTKNSMLSGIIYGFACLTDELVKKIKTKIGKSTLVIGTGGDIDLMAKYCKQFDKIDKHLTLRGLNLIYFNQKNFS